MKRYVRVMDDLFDQLARMLPQERGADGTPSVADFVHSDLVRIHDHFAHHWDDLPQPIRGRPDYRLHIGRGTYVASYAVAGQLAPDGWIELVQIEIQRHPSDPEPDDE